MQVSGKAVMCESQIESVLGTEHPAPPDGELALCAGHCLLGKSDLTS